MRRTVGFFLALSLLASTRICLAQPAMDKKPDTVKASDASEKTCRQIANALVELIPHEYEDTRKWGMQKEVWDGLHISTDGLRIKTKRRKKLANHGTWKRYHVRLINPEKNLRLSIENIHDADGGGLAFDTVLDCRLHAFARLSEYNRGVQLISLSANADATVRLRVSFKVAMRLDITRLPPDIVIDPKATGGHLQLLSFHMTDISKIHGSLAEELGRGLRDILLEKLEKRREKLLAKVNRKIDQKQDRLRLSLSDLAASTWEKLKGKEKEEEKEEE